jgi:hypothetical protein
MKTRTLILTAVATLAFAAPAAKAVSVPDGRGAAHVATPAATFVAVDPLHGQRGVRLDSGGVARGVLVGSGKLDPPAKRSALSAWWHHLPGWWLAPPLG